MDKYDGYYARLQSKLRIDCEKCSGLCCVALYCMKTDGFPSDKEAGVPCKHLMSDFCCDIHPALVSKNMRGCLAYDCFGAGQKVTQQCYSNINWKSTSDKANEIFQVFLNIFQLHQMEWYLLESLSLTSDEYLNSDIKALIFENEKMTDQSPGEILKIDVESYRLNVNQTLKKVCESITISSFNNSAKKDFFGKNFNKVNLDYRDFSMSLLIAANLEGCSLRHVNFLGADIRDANIKNTDLSECVFLTQMQINSAKGNAHTKLPQHLSPPTSWNAKIKGDELNGK